MLRIDDEVTALDFDLTCAARLKIYDSELEQQRLEAMSGGLLSKALATPPSNTLNGKFVGEITPANFRDQGF